MIQLASKFPVKNTAFFGCLLLIGSLVFSCGNDDPKEEDAFDKKATLELWADNFIISGYEEHKGHLTILQNSVEKVGADFSIQDLSELRSAFRTAYLSWQRISMFNVGKAEELRLRDFTNIYPCDTPAIKENILSESYDLTKLSTIDQQGFPALDYLLFGVFEQDDDLLGLLGSKPGGDYIKAVVSRLVDSSDEVLANWKTDFRKRFIENDGSSSTSSASLVVNEYVKYIEKYIRSGKVGIPAGVFSGNPLPNLVEAPFIDTLSQRLFTTSLLSAKDFFNGKTKTAETGESLGNWLDFLNQTKNGEDLTKLINRSFDTVLIKADECQPSFAKQITDDNTKMLALYDELQKLLVLLKVDMMQALNISVDYVDADGD